MKGDDVPSKKPRFEGRIDFDISEKAEAFCKHKGWNRGQLVREAIAQYLSENVVVVPLEAEDKDKLNQLAKEHNRPIGYEGRNAIVNYLEDQTQENTEKSSNDSE